ncbi:unnamed protein product, partial [Discosporangium mesarthrocarpum]
SASHEGRVKVSFVMPPKRGGKEAPPRDGKKQRNIHSFFSSDSSKNTPKQLEPSSQRIQPASAAEIPTAESKTVAIPGLGPSSSGKGRAVHYDRGLLGPGSSAFVKASSLVGAQNSNSHLGISDFQGELKTHGAPTTEERLCTSPLATSSLVRGGGEADFGNDTTPSDAGRSGPHRQRGRKFQPPRPSWSGAANAYSSSPDSPGDKRPPSPWDCSTASGYRGRLRDKTPIHVRINVVGLQSSEGLNMVVGPGAPVAGVAPRDSRVSQRTIMLHREPYNAHDGNAIQVLLGHGPCEGEVAARGSEGVELVGYLPAKMAGLLAPLMDCGGAELSIALEAVSGGGMPVPPPRSADGGVGASTVRSLAGTVVAPRGEEEGLVAAAISGARRSLPAVVSILPCAALGGYSSRVDGIMGELFKLARKQEESMASEVRKGREREERLRTKQRTLLLDF